MVQKHVVRDDECCHAFDDRQCPLQYAWVVASLGFQCRRLALLINGMLLLCYRGDWFECNAEVDVFAVADSALNASAVVGRGVYLAVGSHEWVVLFRPSHAYTAESLSVVESLRCIY